MFLTIEEKANGLVARFPIPKGIPAVHLNKETVSDEGDCASVVSPLLAKPHIFPHGDDKEAAVAEAEQFFRDLVNAVAEQKPLNFTDFELRSPTKSRTKSKQPAKTTPEGA